MEALRARSTAVDDRERAYGHSAMIRLAEENGGLPRGLQTLPVPGWARFFSRFAAIRRSLAFCCSIAAGRPNGLCCGC